MNKKTPKLIKISNKKRENKFKITCKTEKKSDLKPQNNILNKNNG